MPYRTGITGQAMRRGCRGHGEDTGRSEFSLLRDYAVAVMLPGKTEKEPAGSRRDAGPKVCPQNGLIVVSLPFWSSQEPMHV